jgi:hypothetical protein
MICPACNTENRVGVAFCSNCKERLPIGGPANRKGLALASLVLAIISIPLIYVFELTVITGLAAAACGLTALVRAHRYPLQFGGRRLAMAGAGLGGLIALLYPAWASLLLPARAKARMEANESAALFDVQTVLAAERVYALANHDYYDTLECLTRPQECVPNYVTDGSRLIDPQLATAAVRSGYRYQLHLGPPASNEWSGQISASSVRSFAYVAEPVKAGATGQRTFCGDDSGVIRVSPRGVPPTIEQGICPRRWEALE